MKYVLMFAGSVQEQEAWEKMPEAVRVTAYERVNQWFEEHSRAGRITGGAELQGPSSSTTVRIKNGKAVVTDGPFIEAKEVIGGYAIFELGNEEDAIELAKTWPAGGTVEVRPLVER